MFGVEKLPWVQVPAGEIGVVAQVGEPLPIGAKSAVYKPEFGNFSSLIRMRANGALVDGLAEAELGNDGVSSVRLGPEC